MFGFGFFFFFLVVLLSGLTLAKSVLSKVKLKV